MSLRLACMTLALLGSTACTAGLGLNSMLAPTPVQIGSVGGGGGAYAHAQVNVHVSFFGIPLDGAQDVVFVLDRSGSMSGVSTGFAGQSVGMSKTQAVLVGLGGTLANGIAGGPLPSKLDAAKQELIGTMRALPDGTRFNIIWFDDELKALSPHMAVLDGRSRAGVEAFIQRIDAGGSTAAVPALDLAYAIGAARIVLLSDGLANTGGGGDTLIARARTAIAHGVRFDTVGLGIDQDADLMQTLAHESGGLAMMR
ncbi:MAG: VWA domain-containing protein [Kofleriaceae bacterium]|nr:VWA domain-containing protein [Kofleriaceae bacterium]